MSDHYCCNHCHQRYDKCFCPSELPKLHLISKSPKAPEEQPVTEKHYNVMIIGYGNLGKTTEKAILDRCKLNSTSGEKTTADLFLVDIDKPHISRLPTSKCNRTALSSNDIDTTPHLKMAEIIIVCLPSHTVSHWLRAYSHRLKDKTVLIRSTLPITFLEENAKQVPQDFAYVPEYSTEHTMRTEKISEIDNYFASTPLATDTVTDLLRPMFENAPFKEVAARKLLRNSAVAINAVYHNWSLMFLRQHGIAPMDINTYDFLDINPEMPRADMPQALRFGGKCLKTSLEMLDKSASTPLGLTSSLWHSLNDFNEYPTYHYVNKLKEDIRKRAGGQKTVKFNLILAGLNYKSDQPTSTVYGSVALDVIQCLHMSHPIRTYLHPKITKMHLEEVKASPNPPPVYAFAEKAHGILLIQPLANVVATIKQVLPPKSKDPKKTKAKPFVIYDPLMQVYPMHIESLRRLTDVPFQVVTHLE